MIENLKGELYFSKDTKEMANWAQQVSFYSKLTKKNKKS